MLHSFVANFVRYISAKYYLNWFLFHTVIMKVLGVNFFFETQCSKPQQHIMTEILRVLSECLCANESKNWQSIWICQT